MNYDLAIQNGTVLVYKDNQITTVKTNIGVTNGKITEISTQPISAEQIIDAKNLHVLPGVIDSQVHFREPGLTHKEDLESGTRSAVMGGVTSVFEMPNTTPPTTTLERLNEKMKLAQGRAWTNYAFYVGGSPENSSTLAELEKTLGCSGIKVFMGSSTGNLLVEDDLTIEKILRSGRRRVIFHAEDETRLKERKHIAIESKDVRSHPVWRDVETALRATQRLLNLARKTARPVHVLHITSAEEVALLKKNKDIATFEITPNHLSFFAPDCYERLGTLVQMNPPIREKSHMEALWKAINDGTADVIGTDHAPHTLEEKAKPYPTSPSGMPGVQTLVPVMLTHVHDGRLRLERFVELVCENPRRVFGCQNKGRIAIGMDADFTLVDLKKQKVIENKWIQSRCGWTPFDGMKATGWPIYTIVNGKIVMQEDSLRNPAQGQKVLFT